MINSDSIVTAYDEHLTLVEWLQKVEVLLKNGGLKEVALNDKGNGSQYNKALFSLTLTFNDGTKIESNDMALKSVNEALNNLNGGINTNAHRIDDLESEMVSTATFTPVKEKANNSLQKPAGLTKTELVGVGTNGQENIEIGDNLTLTNGKLSATGGGSGGEKICIVKFNLANFTYTSNIPLPTDGTTPVFVDVPSSNSNCIYPLGYDYKTDEQGSHYVSFMSNAGTFFYVKLNSDGTVTINNTNIINKYYYHFITMIYSASNVALYLTIYNTSETEFDAFSLYSYLAGNKVLANGNLHGSVPTYIEGGVVSGSIKVYYMNSGDNNINPTPDEYQHLSSFTITDLVLPVE